LHAPRGLARGLHRGQQQRYQNADNGDDNQQFHERETPRAAGDSQWHGKNRIRGAVTK
jgi:hypothetical protein